MQKQRQNQLYDVPLLQEQMQQLNFSHRKLAKAAGVSHQTIYACMAGNLGNLRVLRKITDALKVEIQFHRVALRAANSKAAR